MARICNEIKVLFLVKNGIFINTLAAVGAAFSLISAEFFHETRRVAPSLLGETLFDNQRHFRR